MAGRARELIIPYVRKLVTNLVGEQESENFQLYEQYVLSSLQHHRFLSVDSHAVRRSIEGIITKFEVHGHLDAAKKLSELLKAYLSCEVFKDHPEYDIQWSLISLLLHLSTNPTANVRCLKTSKDIPEKEDEKEDFDWVSYLREGDENFGLGVYDTEDLNENWDSYSADKCDSESDLSDSANASEEQSLDGDVEDKEIVKVNQKEDFIRALQEIQASENWLETKFQHYSCILQEDNDAVCRSKHPSANFASRHLRYLEAQGSDTSNFHVLSEYQVIRQVLWMFHAPSSSFVFTQQENKIEPKTNIAIPSLSPDALYEYLSYFCPYLNMLDELRRFGNEVVPEAGSECTSPPHSYEAYWAAVQELLKEFQSFLISIEEKVIMQDCTYTLVSLRSDLKEKLTELKTIHCVHKKAVCNWKEVSNRESASRLLSVLYGELTESSTNNSSTFTIMLLFFKTFRVYVDIMDTWMTDGFLEDWREEFIIARNCNQILEKKNDVWMQGYAVHANDTALVNAGLPPMQLMEVAMTSVLHAGKSMDLLLELGRLPDLRKKTTLEGSLYQKLLSSIEMDLSKYSCIEEDTQTFQDKTELSVNFEEEEKNKNIIPDIKDHLLYFADPLLIKGLENYLDLSSTDSVNGLDEIGQFTKESKEKDVIFKRLKGYLNCPILPLKSILETNLRRLVQEKQMVSCSMLTSMFLHELKLSMHMKVIRSVFLMEAGDIMHQFCAILFKQMEIGQVNSFSLSCSLENCIDVRFPEYGSRFSFLINHNDPSASVLEQMNTIQLQYKVDWPLSLVLNNYNMELYNAVFRFLLKIKWALWNLQQLRFSDLEEKNVGKVCSREQESSIVHRLQFLRFWLLHSISSIHSYLMGQIINLLGPQLEQNVENAPDLDTIIDVHNNYVHTIYARCLQPGGNDVIKTAILQMVMTSISMCHVWHKNSMLVSDAKLKEVGELYFKCHCFLGIVLSNMVENGAAPQFGELCAAFDAPSLQKHLKLSVS